MSYLMMTKPFHSFVFIISSCSVERHEDRRDWSLQEPSNEQCQKVFLNAWYSREEDFLIVSEYVLAAEISLPSITCYKITSQYKGLPLRFQRQLTALQFVIIKGRMCLEYFFIIFHAHSTRSRKGVCGLFTIQLELTSIKLTAYF